MFWLSISDLKSSSPQIPLEDMQIIYVVIAGSMIRKGSGYIFSEQLLIKVRARMAHHFLVVFADFAFPPLPSIASRESINNSL